MDVEILLAVVTGLLCEIGWLCAVLPWIPVRIYLHVYQVECGVGGLPTRLVIFKCFIALYE